MSADALLVYLFDGQPHVLAQPMAAWLSASRRFATFVTAFQDKIRKKIRARPDEDSLLDLRLELETAYLLLRERSLSLAYEPEQAGPGRSPDFAVTFTTRLTFMAEVTRLHAEAQRQGQATAPLGERLTDSICSKLGQLRPQHGNILIVGVEPLSLTPDDLRAVMLRMQQRAERNDSGFLQRHRFRDRADFFRHFQRLSEVLVRGVPLQAGEPTVVWVNPQAQVPLPARVRTALIRSHSP